MSLLSPDHALVLLSGRVLLRAGGRLWEQAGESGWEGSLAALDKLLGEAKVKGAVRASLSHHYARALLVAPPPVRLKAEEMDGWVRGQLVQDYGAEAESWRLAWQDVAPGHPVPVAAMDAARYDALAQHLAARGLKLVRAEPWLVGIWQRQHRAIGRKSGWLALVEPARIVLARVEHGRLLSTRTVQADTGLVESLTALLAREALQCAVPAGGDLWLAAPDLDAAWHSLAPDFRVHELVPSQGGWGRLLS